MKRNVTDRQV